MISLATVTQTNPVALRRTVDNLKASFGGLCNEFVVGDVSIFPGQFSEGFDDVRFIPMEFNYLFKHGFASALNHVASHATNDLCLYLNVAEIVGAHLNASVIKDEFNCYPFNHAEDPHIWVRMWDRRELSWSGRIHEEIVGPKRQCPHLIFQMADTPKDDKDDFHARVYNDVKEMVYFQQYVHLVEHPEELGATNVHWLNYARSEYDDLKRRLDAKGARYQAFIDGDKEAYIKAATENPPPKEWGKSGGWIEGT